MRKLPPKNERVGEILVILPKAWYWYFSCHRCRLVLPVSVLLLYAMLYYYYTTAVIHVCQAVLEEYCCHRSSLQRLHVVNRFSSTAAG